MGSSRKCKESDIGSSGVGHDSRTHERRCEQHPRTAEGPYRVGDEARFRSRSMSARTVRTCLRLGLEARADGFGAGRMAECDGSVATSCDNDRRPVIRFWSTMVSSIQSRSQISLENAMVAQRESPELGPSASARARAARLNAARPASFFLTPHRTLFRPCPAHSSTVRPAQNDTPTTRTPANAPPELYSRHHLRVVTA